MKHFAVFICCVVFSSLTGIIGCSRNPEAGQKAAGDGKVEPVPLQGKNSTQPGTSLVRASKETPEQKARNLQSKALEGFSRLTKSDRPDEEWIDYRGKQGPTHFLRQDGVGGEMEWETTAPGESPKEQPVIFMFAGAVGYINDPKTEGFSLLVNDQEVLRFDVTLETQEWKGKDDGVSLFYYPTWSGPTGPDSSGLFFLTLPKDRVTQAQPCRLAVRSLGEGTRRWFGVHPLADVTRTEVPSPSK